MYVCMCVYVCMHACMHMYVCALTYGHLSFTCLAVHLLGKKWQNSEDFQMLIDELDPLLDKAIHQPDGKAPKYATNPLTQVSSHSQLGLSQLCFKTAYYAFMLLSNAKKFWLLLCSQNCSSIDCFIRVFSDWNV